MATLQPTDQSGAVLNRDNLEAKGATVHSFDPDATPAQKGAVAGKGTENLSSFIDQQPSAPERAIDSSPANGNSRVIPTILIEDSDAEDKKVVAKDTQQVAEKVQAAESNGTAIMPGGVPAKEASEIPDWYIVGWRQMAGLDKPPLAEGEEREKHILEQFVSEQYYGSWYHNAAVIVVAVLASHFFTRFGFGWGWLFILLAVCNTYYTTSMDRFYRNARDDIQRDLVKTSLGSEHETADWLNNFLERFWLIYEPVMSNTIVRSVDQVLSAYTPAFLDSLRLTEFTLGTKAPRIDKVRTFPKTEDDIVMMDWAVSFTPTDERDMTKRQAAAKVNPRIVLTVRLGKGLATAGLPVLVEDITFSGLMRVKMKLITNFPHIQVVDICFLEKPVIDYVLKPVGGDAFGLDIASIPGLSSFIRDTTHSILGPMMYAPNVFTLNLEQLLSGKPLDTAMGVLQVTIHSARGIKGVKIGGGSPDPYVSLSINDRNELARTTIKENTYNPTWAETKYVLINSLHERLVLDLYDYNDHRSDQKLGTTSYDLNKLEDDAIQEGIHGQLLKDGKDRGELRYDVAFYPVLEPEPETNVIPESTVGIVRLVVHQAKELDHTKSLTGELNPLAKVYLNANRKPSFTVPRLKRTNNPVWESAYEFFCTSKDSDVVTVKVIDERELLKDPVVGHMSIRLVDLIDAKVEGGRDWFPLSGCKSGRLRISAEWKPVAMAGSLHGAGQYTPPIGVVRLHLNKAVDVKNVEAALGGKSDPYVRVQVRNVTKGRTEVVNNNLNPVWDQIIYIPVHSLKESLLLECMDYQHLTKDRSLGSTEVHLSELASQSEDPKYPYQSTGAKDAADPLRLDRGNSTKGTLHYSATFIPALKLKDISFGEQSTALSTGRVKGADEEADSDKVSVNSNSPIALTIKPSKKKSTTSLNGGLEPSKANGTNGTTTETPTTAKPKDFAIDSGDEATTSSSGDAHSKAESEAGVEMSVEELLTNQSGIVVFHVLSAHLEKKGRIEVLLDEGYWPSFSTERARSTHSQFDSVGEGFLKEVDFGQVWLRLNDADEGDKDDVVCEWKGDAKEFLLATMRSPQSYSLTNRNGDSETTILIESRYIPVPVKLEPRESINNQGVLRVELIDGHEIRGVDRGGKSDPYVVFALNDNKVFKSQTKKKTLTPEWNEAFEIQVPSRVAADFQLEVFDWNQIEQAKSLGIGRIDLASLEPFEASELSVPLSSQKHGEKGYIRIRLVFQPGIIAKQRKNTSTFTSAGRAMTQIGGLPVTAGKGVFHGVTGVFKRSGDKDRNELDVALADVPAGQASRPILGPAAAVGTAGGLAAFPTSDAPSSNEPGTLRVTVIDAKDLSQSEIKPYVVLRVGDKEHKTKHTSRTAAPEWNESFKFSASTLTPKIHVWVWEHKTIGKDKEVAEGEVDIWRHIRPDGVSASEVLLELKDGGLLRLRLEYDASTNPMSSRASISSSSENGLSRTMSIVNPSRFSIRGKRPTEEE
ncbi:transmembrane protein [Coprinopsis marcescibilis]|uniref:Transmembrane protein n=1 Tax=Coprinopsis marcescibilis TaxID=230819 RepID=A0A5C3LCB0_COPMA|nr:transmembrane protein [Coprinopsis marcescibilis]